MALLVEIAENQDHPLRNEAQESVIQHLPEILRAGCISTLESLFGRVEISAEQRSGLLRMINEFLRYDSGGGSKRRKLPEGYLSQVSEWLGILQPSDFHGRLVAAVGVNPWEHTRRRTEDSWQEELRVTAKKLYQDRPLLERELAWLFSDKALSAAVLGVELGKLDSSGALLEAMVHASLEYSATALARGYIRGVLQASQSIDEPLNRLLDKAGRKNPKVAYELFMAGGERADALGRALKLVDDGSLSSSYLNGFAWNRSLRPWEVHEILKRFVDKADDAETLKTAIEFIYYELRPDEDTPDEEAGISLIATNSDAQDLLWRLLARAAKTKYGLSYEGSKILEAMMDFNPDKAAQVGAIALVHGFVMEGFVAEEEENGSVLTKLARKYPDIFMREIGRLAFDEEEGWHFYVDKYTFLIQALPDNVVRDWIASNGVEAARLLARHLPGPHLNSEGEPCVPPITEYVLERFEEDDRVFEEFVAGTHAFQTYWGDFGAQHEQEAELARRFLSHPLKRVREWAAIEVESALQSAERSRQRQEERMIG